jgi:uncharacterized protein YggT (Ycf19 family)
MLSLIFKIAYTVSTFIQTLIVFRIVLKIINADSTNKFVSWIYSITDSAIQPFKGIVAESITIDRFTIELTPLIALLFFAVLGFVLSELAKAFRQSD